MRHLFGAQGGLPTTTSEPQLQTKKSVRLDQGGKDLVIAGRGGPYSNDPMTPCGKTKARTLYDRCRCSPVTCTKHSGR